MSLLRTALLALMLVLSSSAWGQPASMPPTDQDAKDAQSLAEGVRLMRATRAAEAIDYFDRVASSYESRFKDNNTQFFSARTMPESLLYLLEVANAHKGSAKVVSINWAYAYYLKGYALLDLNRIPEAKSLLQQALELSPRNSQFLSELGHIHQLERNWPSALREFQLSEAAAREFSPPDVRDAELSRAWRGMGYALAELKRYDDAEQMYRKCLELNKNDAAATNELRYLQSVKPKTIIQ